MTDKPPEVLLFERRSTPIGEALLVVDEAGRLRAFDWSDHEPRLRRLLARHYGALTPAAAVLPAALGEAFERYFAGELTALAGIEWRTAGTAFQASTARMAMRAARGMTAATAVTPLRAAVSWVSHLRTWRSLVRTGPSPLLGTSMDAPAPPQRCAGASRFVQVDARMTAAMPSSVSRASRRSASLPVA